MSRYKQHFITQYNPQQVIDYFNSYMQKEGFSVYNNNGETCWKKGMGLVSAPQYIKLYQENGTYVLEAWLKYALFPGVYVGEMGIKGITAALPKSMLKTRVDSILKSLHAQLVQPVPSNTNVPNPQQPQYINGNNQANNQNK